MLIENEARASLLKERFKLRGIKMIAMDFDDTLIDTNDLFATVVDVYIERTSDITGTPKDEIARQLKVINNKAFKTHSVRPDRWMEVGIQLSDHFNNGCFRELVPMLMGIYSRVPKFHSGAEATLQTFHSTGAKLIVVTHANEEWTKKKYLGLKMNRFLNWNDVYIVDCNVHKADKHWLNAINSAGYLPQQALVVGDSLPGDIHPAIRIGVKHVVRVPSPWSVYGQGDSPEGVFDVARGIDGVVDCLLARL